MKKWPEEAYEWYREACEMFNYPAGPYGEQVKALIASGDTVLDLGCGIGAASVMMSPWCKRVIALDQDENALRCLTDKAQKSGISNIETAHESWPLSQSIKADVVIALHVAQVMRSFSNLKLVFESANKGGFIACQSPVSRQDEPFWELKEDLGITPNYEKCDNGCYIKGALEALGASVTCKKNIYEFGQPLKTQEEAVRFISWQIDANDSMAQIIKKHLDRYVVKVDGGYLVPITRQTCGISFFRA